MKIGVLGLGKMGEALVRGIRSSSEGKKWKVEATTRSLASAKQGSKSLGIPVHTDNLKLAASCDALILCVKPSQAQQVLSDIAPVLASRKKTVLLISVAAAITTRQMQEWVSDSAAVIRSMPNTPALIGEGMTVLCAAEDVSSAQLKLAEKIFATVGKTVVLDESLMDGATGLSGCGPAYAYLIIEALSEDGPLARKSDDARGTDSDGRGENGA
jgi:pyrroline-5-carboxylate reductase